MDTILNDLPFTLEGISSPEIQFLDLKNVDISADLPSSYFYPIADLTEPALLYKQLSSFSTADSSNQTLQALKSSISLQLQKYLILVSVIGKQPHEKVSPSRCLIWLNDATLALRAMKFLVDSSDSKSILNNLYELSINGDQFLANLSIDLLQSTSIPFYKWLHLWLTTGSLPDQQNDDFFIKYVENEQSFQIQKNLLPKFISLQTAENIFQIGKTLGFVKLCNDTSFLHSCSQKIAPFSFNELPHDAQISDYHNYVISHLSSLLNTHLKLNVHLTAMKEYLFLGRGDFVTLLIETLSPVLSRPASTLYRHSLTVALESALRSTNCQYLPQEIQSCLDARLLDLSHGHTGWDVFTLEYRFDSPINVVITPWCSVQYLKIFNLLWRIRRVEYELNSSWKNSTFGARSILMIPELAQKWHPVRGAISEMICLVNQLQYYLVYEVIESSWAELQHDLAQPPTGLDSIIQAHKRYIERIVYKGLLAPESGDITAVLHSLLKQVINFTQTITSLYSKSVSKALTPSEHTSQLQAIFDQLATIHSLFRSNLKQLLILLNEQQHAQMRPLAIRLNYNNFYLLRKKKST
ncbi:hypothetical protein CANCADRAFT_115978 [Tortispora caseinolytica NRRL Y-17796]|uniref:Uncharacterized protein n=1 Tax=Tortispora caseinolytica NRRL Y-17796 TaxID=767744 RepID=A0A1E4TH27_9ASCO|nr:hypothetical protein CANCADRAFT_115978 [Tortispora caseinolytica NRRL Y-17796]